MDDQTYITDITGGPWETVSTIVQHLSETKVSLLTVVILFLVYIFREAVGLVMKWRKTNE